MKKFIIAIGLLAFIAASNIPSWAENKPIYVCYLEKNQQVQRFVYSPAKCKSSEIAMAVSSSTKTGASDSQDQQGSKKNLKDSPALSAAILESSGSSSSGSGW
jgi:hypothetical protein